MKRDFNYFVEKSIIHKGENKSYKCNLVLKVDGKKYQSHEVSICKRDLLFFTNKGTLNFVVDSIGFNNYAELVYIDE